MLKENHQKSIQKNDNIHKLHRQRLKERFLTSRFDNFAEHEILEFLLFFSIPQGNTNPIAHKLLDRYHSLSAVLDASYESLLTNDGVGSHSAILIKTLPALLNTYKTQKANKISQLTNQLVAIDYVSNLFFGSNIEEFYIICVDANSVIIDTKRLTSESFNKVEISLREVTKFVLNHDCDRIFIAHNHITPPATPSNDDILLTKKIFTSCTLNDIQLVDHIIYSPAGCYSFAETGLMNEIKNNVLGLFDQSIIREYTKKFHSSHIEYKIVPRENQ